MDESKFIKVKTKKKTSVLESSRCTAIIKFINSKPECLVRKRHQAGFQSKGDPDITGCIQGRHVEIEVKQPGKKPTALQVQRLMEWDAVGAVAGIATDVESAAAILREHGIIL